MVIKGTRRGGLYQRGSFLLLICACAAACSAKATTFDARDPNSPIRLVRTISLPDVRGRIDHMAIDSSGAHLFIAELGNGTIDEVDLSTGKVAGRIRGLREPQGVAWLPAQKEIAVASADGLVRFFRSSDLSEVARISLGNDADNVRVDPRNGHLIVGYGSGGLAIIDPGRHQLLARVPLAGHPEAFVLNGEKAFINVPSRRQIAVANLDEARLVSNISTGLRSGNYPMAIDPTGSAIAIGFRFPPSVWLRETAAGRVLLSASICGDADDIYFVGNKLLLVCGEGAVELVSLKAGHPVERVTTSSGARTGLVTADGKTLFVAAPAKAATAQLWELVFQ